MPPAYVINGQDRHAIAQADLFTVLVALARDNARAKFPPGTATKMTDSTTGTALKSTLTLPATPTPAPYLRVSGNDLAPKAGFDTAIGKLSNVAASVAVYLNRYRSAFGLPLVGRNTGTVTAAAPALDKTLTGVDGTSSNAVDAVTGAQQIVIAENNLSTLIHAANQVLAALGNARLTDNSGGTAYTSTLTLANSAATAAGVTGTGTAKSLANTATGTTLTALADGYATLLYWLNFYLDPLPATNLTDNSGGTASATLPPTLTAVTKVFTGYTDVTTSSAPKAAFDTECPKIANNFADLAGKINDLVRYQDITLGLLTDNSGGTGDLTLQVISSTLTAVSGAGSTALSKTSADAIFTIFANTFATLAAKVNLLSAVYGLPALVDNTTGTASATGTLAAVGVSGAGVDNTSAATGVQNTVLNVALAVVKDNMATIAARVSALDDFNNTRPLTVVAGL
jgi:hypothetical protein